MFQLREWMAELGQRAKVKVAAIGKFKTVAQMVASPMLLYYEEFLGIDCRLLGSWLMWVAALLTLWSMGYYLRMAWPEIAARSQGD